MQNKYLGITEILEGASFELATLHPSAFSGLCDVLESTLASPSKASLDKLSSQLVRLVQQQFQLAQPEVRESIISLVCQGVPTADLIRVAYHLGQLSFAQNLASQAANRRVSDTFIPTLRSRPYRRYIRMLDGRDLTKAELVTTTNEELKTVNRKLKVLLELGAVDFRREGGKTTYSLTSAGKQCVKLKVATRTTR